MVFIHFATISQDDYIILIRGGDVGGFKCRAGTVFKFNRNTYGEFMAIELCGRDSRNFRNIRHTLLNYNPRFRQPYKNELRHASHNK